MGACLSCLGFGPREYDGENPETSRLIDDDPYRSQYGSNNRHPQRAAYQPDPESLRREREALEGICHSMSDEVIDVFTVLSSSNEGNLRRPKSPIPMACVTKNTQDEEPPEAIEFKTIRRGRLGPIASPLKRDELGKWQTIAEIRKFYWMDKIGVIMQLVHTVQLPCLEFCHNSLQVTSLPHPSGHHFQMDVPAPPPPPKDKGI